jgi:23S rRNA (pseudouridine1915-N3)-methyltransferase
MRIYLISVGTKMPPWVTQGYQEYAKRLPPECTLYLVEIPAGRRGKGLAPLRAVADEGTRMLKALPARAWVIALEVSGQAWSTEALAGELARQLGAGHDMALLVGGPEGLAAACRERADARWSLSRLTFPHPLVRVIVAEQLYRAWSLLQGHPYHRG